MAKKITKKFLVLQKKRLEEEKTDILHHIANLKKGDPFADPEHVNDNAAVDTDVREQVGHETVEAEIKDLDYRLKDIELALIKLEKGRYGSCERCGMLLLLARLKLVPEARYCIDCEKKLKKQS